MPKLKLTLRTVIDPQFIAAFDKLGSDDIPVKARFSLARTRKIIVSHIETYEESRVELLKRIGRPENEILNEQLTELQKNKEQNSAVIQAIEKRLEHLKGRPTSYAIANDDEATLDKFTKELKELQNVEFDTDLDAPIALSDKSQLSAGEISALLDIVTVAEG